ncbi:MAG: hypothetical protein LIO65_04585 [Odoribacter sp.]|nr:hypothetical protein [Odoribacter sp.]
MTGNILGSISSVTGNILSGLGSSSKDNSSNTSSFFENLDINFDGKELSQDTRQLLRQTGVKEFQPDYIKNQISAVRSDLQRSIKQLALNPQNSENIIDGFTNRLQNRINDYASNIDREKVVTAIMNTANVSRAQAESTVDQYMELIEQGREELNNLDNTIQEAKQEWEQMKQETLKKTEKVANSAAWTAIWSFVALLIGAVICSFAGQYGVKVNRRGYEV